MAEDVGSINIPSNDGRTALHIAAWEGRTECVKVLVASGVGYCYAAQLLKLVRLLFCVLGSLFVYAEIG